MKYILYFYISTSHSMRTVPSMAGFFFCCISLISCFSGSCSGIVWVILKWFQSPLLLLVSLLFSHSTGAEFLFWGLYTFKSPWLLSLSHFCLQELQHILNARFLLSRIMMPSLLLGIVLSVRTCFIIIVIICLFVFLALQPIVVVFSQPGSGL